MKKLLLPLLLVAMMLLTACGIDGTTYDLWPFDGVVVTETTEPNLPEIVIPEGAVDFDVLNNHDTGDNNLFTVTYGINEYDEDFLAIIDAGDNLDFEVPGHIIGWMYQTNSVDEALTRFDLSSVQLDPDYLFVVSNRNGITIEGAEQIVANVTYNHTFGHWILTTWQYPDDEETIYVPEAEWTTILISWAANQTVAVEEGTITYCQFWTGTDANEVTHIIAEDDFQIANAQGTCWNVTGGNRGSLIERFQQMTDEVAARDHPDDINLFYYGDGSTPDGYIHQP